LYISGCGSAKVAKIDRALWLTVYILLDLWKYV